MWWLHDTIEAAEVAKFQSCKFAEYKGKTNEKAMVKTNTKKVTKQEVEVPKPKSGVVALLGRPNTGKSTLVNNLIGQKVSITSPTPQTTRFPVMAVYEDVRGQIVFVDTPGIFTGKSRQGKSLNMQTEDALKEQVDVLLYIVDHTRKRGSEENRVLGIARKLKMPKILVINKIDVREPTYLAHYRFMEEEFDDVIEVSALKRLHLPTLLDEIFVCLPTGERIVPKENMEVPIVNLDSRTYMSELIREKIFLTLRREVPYAVEVVIDELEERENGVTYIKARLITYPRYKKMVIGAKGHTIKQIGMMVRKEIEVSTGRPAYIDLSVEAQEKI